MSRKSTSLAWLAVQAWRSLSYTDLLRVCQKTLFTDTEIKSEHISASEGVTGKPFWEVSL